MRKYRSKANHRSIALIVVTDADHLTVPERYRTLEKALKDAGQPPRRDDERIALVIPKRNIETWVHHLLDNHVDESTDYKPLYRGGEGEVCRRAAREMDAHMREASPNCCPPSLLRGRQELDRIA